MRFAKDWVRPGPDSLPFKKSSFTKCTFNWLSNHKISLHDGVIRWIPAFLEISLVSKIGQRKNSDCLEILSE